MQISRVETILSTHFDRLLRDLTRYAHACGPTDPGYPPEDIASQAIAIALELRLELGEKRIDASFWRLRGFLRRVVGNLASNHRRIRYHRTHSRVVDEACIVRTALARSSDAMSSPGELVAAEERHPVLRQLTILAIAEDRPARTG